jgi:hypothetical protein
MAKLTTKQRDALKPEDFAVPGKRLLPLHDKTHVDAAWRLLPHTHGLTEEEYAEAERRILARAKHFGIDTSKWNTSDKKKSKVSTEAISTEGFSLRDALLTEVRMLLGD